jgi:hypothetical protein
MIFVDRNKRWDGNKVIRKLNILTSLYNLLMRWAEHLARMGKRGMHIGYWWESEKERDHWEDQDEGGRIILKWIVET